MVILITCTLSEPLNSTSHIRTRSKYKTQFTQEEFYLTHYFLTSIYNILKPQHG